MIDQKFAAYVCENLGDIPVEVDGEFISQKVRNYWRAWCLSKSGVSLEEFHSACSLFDDTYDFGAGGTFTVDRSSTYLNIYRWNNK